MRTAWRLIKRVYATEAFTGTGSRLHGTRWTPRGVPVVHTAESAALAAWEVVIHLPQHALPSDYVIVRVELPEEAITRLEPRDLPAGWDATPHPRRSRRWGPAGWPVGLPSCCKSPAS